MPPVSYGSSRRSRTRRSARSRSWAWSPPRSSAPHAPGRRTRGGRREMEGIWPCVHHADRHSDQPWQPAVRLVANHRSGRHQGRSSTTSGTPAWRCF